MEPDKGERRMLKKTICLISFILFIAVGVAQAQVSITYSSMGEQHFTMTIPDDWRVNVGSEVDLSQNAAHGTTSRFHKKSPALRREAFLSLLDQ